MVAASRDSNADDEHDPEGATIAFERAQLGAILSQSVADLAEHDAALERLAAGGYGRCERCGEPIAPARLDARPTARLCIACASSDDLAGRTGRPRHEQPRAGHVHVARRLRRRPR